MALVLVDTNGKAVCEGKKKKKDILPEHYAWSIPLLTTNSSGSSIFMRNAKISLAYS